MNALELEARIRAFLREELGVADGELTADTPLISSGIVDSAGLIRLAALLEAELGITIPDRDVKAENFDTLRKVHAYLEGKGSG